VRAAALHHYKVSSNTVRQSDEMANTSGYSARSSPHAHQQIPFRTADQSLARLDALATVMDSAFRIPGTNVTMGVDAMLGLLPGIGDAISATISSYLIWEAKQLGAPKLLLARMAGNVAIDTVIGAVPFLGDVFDVAYKANKKNIALLKKHIDKHGLRNNGTIEVAYEEIKR
jgi:Domain of unknown function (DUF4112)